MTEMFNVVTKTIPWGNKTIKLETGKIARQATGAVVASMGKTIVLCTVVARHKAAENVDFFPLTVNYLERFYAAGKFPGGFNKRESRPSERETLISRLIDRPIRPLFPQGFFNDVQVICTTLAYDPECQPDIVALIGASAALAISGVPFMGPIGASRVGYKDGEYFLNPSAAEIADGSLLDLVVAGTKDAVLMVESEAKELSEEIMLGAVAYGHEQFKNIISAIEEFKNEAGKPAWNLELPNHSDLLKKIEKLANDKIKKAYSLKVKQDRVEAIEKIYEEIKEKFIVQEELNPVVVKSCFKQLEKDFVRGMIISSEKRIDGRSPVQVRRIESEIDILPQVHGSALFTRGETQVVAVATLGTGSDEQIIDDIESDRKERFLLHYNFPPFSVGEVGFLKAPGRREIGHGKLAYRSINALLPSKDIFPYTIRVVSEVTESNGSSSMATVCGTSLALMAAGVPLASPIAGIAMGLVLEGKNYVVLSDIMGDEDHLGDMDFKVAGTEKGVTALQMDIKISGITEEIMGKALNQAKDGRLHILGEMARTITKSRTELASSAPQIKTIQIPKEKIGELIGPGGKVVKDIIEKTGVKIDISDDGKVNVASTANESMEAALKMINDIIAVPEIGMIYNGSVVKIAEFGAFVRFMGKTEGLVHISEISAQRVANVRDVLKEGEEIKVKVIEIDRSGKIKLSMKQVSPKTGDAESVPSVATAPSENTNDAVESEKPQESADLGETREDKPRKHKFAKKPGFNKGKFSNKGPRPNEENRSNNGNSQSSEEASPSTKKRRFF